MSYNKKVADLSVDELRLILIEALNETKTVKTGLIPRIDAARLLQVSTRCIDKWCKKGILIKVKVGGACYITSDSIHKRIRSLD